MKIEITTRGNNTTILYTAESPADFHANEALIDQYGFTKLLGNFDGSRYTYVEVICSPSIHIVERKADNLRRQ